MQKRKLRLICLEAVLVGIIVVYVGGYVLCRQTHIDNWPSFNSEHDTLLFWSSRKGDLIFYYLYKPLLCVDKKLTGIEYVLDGGYIEVFDEGDPDEESEQQ